MAATAEEESNLRDMSRRVRQTRDDLERQLQEQLGLLESSVEAFDAGYKDDREKVSGTICTADRRR